MSRLLLYINRKNEINEEIMTLNKMILKLKKEKKDINKLLWKECKHCWVVDDSASSDDLCNKYCKICYIYNNKFIYS
jgi:hypothetical protein